ncbi:hypothetical protein B0H10DRAFT_1955095 [Mycena sp. CBHHK59/15]|nr:hypothetical protein B0H10DRAFT_1955095 [Mycena sp. CBHHK59/15]
MSALYDEIVVIFVSDDQEATADMFKRTPFLVRRGRILRALNWLKANNPLYCDITIDFVALAEYPDDDDGCVPFPVQHIDAQIPISVSGTFDVDNTETALNVRKIQALRQLKAGGSFIKSSTTAETLSTHHNPTVYGMLWPTLYPYGVGMFDDPICLRKELGFKPIMLKSHVRHYLQLADCRFQTHLTFPFAMHNIQMIRKSSFQSHLAVRWAWWPNAMLAMSKIDDNILITLTASMAGSHCKWNGYGFLSGISSDSMGVFCFILIQKWNGYGFLGGIGFVGME